MRLAVHTKRRENLIVNNVLGLFGGGGSHHGLFGGAGLFSHSPDYVCQIHDLSEDTRNHHDSEH